MLPICNRFRGYGVIPVAVIYFPVRPLSDCCSATHWTHLFFFHAYAMSCLLYTSIVTSENLRLRCLSFILSRKNAAIAGLGDNHVEIETLPIAQVAGIVNPVTVGVLQIIGNAIAIAVKGIAIGLSLIHISTRVEWKSWLTLKVSVGSMSVGVVNMFHGLPPT